LLKVCIAISASRCGYAADGRYAIVSALWRL